MKISKRIQVLSIGIMAFIVVPTIILYDIKISSRERSPHPHEIQGIEVKSYSFENERKFALTAIQERYITTEKNSSNGDFVLESVGVNGKVYERKPVGFLNLEDSECIYASEASNLDIDCKATSHRQRGFFVVIMKYHPQISKVRLFKKGVLISEVPVVKLEQVESERQGLQALSAFELAELRNFEKIKFKE